jgi:PST family polysaccharide transporter
MIILVIKLNIVGAFYAMALNQILALFITIVWMKKLPFSKSKSLTLGINNAHFKNLTKFSLMAIFAPLCLISATLFVRFYLNHKLGYNYAGSWEGMWRLSAIYIMFITTTFQFYLLPTFSNMTDTFLKKEVFKVWTYSIPAIIIATVSVYLLKDYIIRIIFSDEFLLINSIILFHLLGDIFKINTWVLGNVLISKAKTKAYIGFQIAWAIEFSILVILFVKNYGFVGVSYAYFGACAIHFLSMNFYFRKLLWLK